MDPIKPPLKSDGARLAKAAYTWLVGRLAYLQKNQSIPGAFNVAGYDNPKYFMLGEVFMYHYDPKLKDTLPYYDTFPLVIPVQKYNDGFLGLNLHYLPPNMRISFFNKLIEYSQAAPGDKRLLMKLSYELLRDSQNLNNYIPCVKRYLAHHIRGRILKIQPHEWLIAVALPTQNFKKATNEQVWRESRSKIQGIKK